MINSSTVHICGQGLYRNLRMEDWNFISLLEASYIFYIFICLFVYLFIYDFSRILKQEL
ncbi:hypothetical protein HanOQP8_Chr09g0311881 [Helianthus annuus]|nr:hypothetical protein HanOQP8_Chr09g0311881 [Helianthus annuus]